MTRCSDSSNPIDVDSIHGESCTPSERDNVVVENIPEPGSGETNDVDVGSGHKRKLTSSVWDHFERRMMKGKMRAICSGCKKDFVGDSKRLETAIMYKDAFTRLKKNSKGKVEKFALPTPHEWQMAKEICDRLALFNRTTEVFSGRHYPTANLYYQKVCEIRLALRKWLCCGNNVIESMARNMIEKFDKYWSVINGILAVASVLDPRRKLECVSFYFHLIYGDSYEFECDRIKQLLFELVADYKSRMHSTHESSSSKHMESSVSYGKRTLDEIDDYENLWDKHVLEIPPKTTCRSEVETYLDEDRIVLDEQKSGLLAWWSANSGKYHILSKIARDVLAVPISTVPSESAFSKGGTLISEHRSRLHRSTVEALMCLQS